MEYENTEAGILQKHKLPEGGRLPDLTVGLPSFVSHFSPGLALRMATPDNGVTVTPLALTSHTVKLTASYRRMTMDCTGLHKTMQAQKSPLLCGLRDFLGLLWK